METENSYMVVLEASKTGKVMFFHNTEAYDLRMQVFGTLMFLMAFFGGLSVHYFAKATKDP